MLNIFLPHKSRFRNTKENRTSDLHIKLGAQSMQGWYLRCADCCFVADFRILCWSRQSKCAINKGRVGDLYSCGGLSRTLWIVDTDRETSWYKALHPRYEISNLRMPKNKINTKSTS